MLKYLVVLLFITILGGTGNVVSGQVPVPSPGTKKFNTDRIFTGGTFDLSFGSVTFVEVSPIIGYKITDQFSVGTGFIYMYYKNQFMINGIHIFGGRLFTSYYILKNVFLHAEDEYLNIRLKNDENEKTTYHINSVLAGGGYSQSIGGKSNLFILLLYNLTPSELSPHKNPVIRIGFNIGL